MSVMYCCAKDGCQVTFCRTAATSERLTIFPFLMTEVKEPEWACKCSCDDSGQSHTCEGCCLATANREATNPAVVACGRVAFLRHCAIHGGCDASL